jgi:RNA polymerase-binding transcription factor DksA
VVAKKAITKNVVAKKALVKKTVAKKTVVKKVPVTRVVAKKASAKVAVAKKVLTNKVVAKTAPTKSVVTKTAPTKKVVAKVETAKEIAPVKVLEAKKIPAPKPVKVNPGYRKDVAFLQRQKEALLEERASRISQEQSQKKEAASLVEEMEPGDVQFDEESGEGGTLAVDREMHLELAAKQRLLVEDIDIALRKIAIGTYGICERCGELIPKARLTAIPLAHICVPCAQGGLSRR